MISADTYMVKPAAGHPIEVEVPGSKSITNRALLIAALAEGESVLHDVLFSDDSRHFIQALIDLGFWVEVDEPGKTVRITGFGGRIPGDGAAVREGTVDVGSAGTAARFLTAFLGLSSGRFTVNSSEQMKKRPMKELLTALEELGAQITYEEEPYHFPLVIGNCGVKKHEVTIDVDKSSQFLSALLICSVLFDEDFVIHVQGHHGMAYVEMTVAMMAQFGVAVERPAPDVFCIPGSASYCARTYLIEPDVSAAAYFYAMCPLLGVPAKVMHVQRESLQGDTQFLCVLEQMGCEVCEEEDGIRLLPPQDGMGGGTFDLSAFSDQALTLAAIACFAKDPVTISGIGHIRYQECDRIHAIMSNLEEIGICCEEPEEGTLVIHPGTPHGSRIRTFEDHRVAMAFSLPGLVTDGIIIENPACCRKTFENYFEVLEEYVCR
jgi:3-phosphoshikimate 1-carboxyvinyltransferase